MTSRFPWAALAAAGFTLALAGCAATGGAPAATTPVPVATASTPAVPEPPSTPIVEQTMSDTVDGTSVTALAIVTDFAAEPPTPGLHAVLVQVRLEAGDTYSSPVRPSVVSITRRDANLEWMNLGMSNPDTLTPAMRTAGYTPLLPVAPGATSTAWIGAWISDDVTLYDLVYSRPAGTVVGGAKNGKQVDAYQEVVHLVAP